MDGCLISQDGYIFDEGENERAGYFWVLGLDVSPEVQRASYDPLWGVEELQLVLK